MKSGEIWVYKNTDYKDVANNVLKIKLIVKLKNTDFWKCENLTPDIMCAFSAPITPDSPRGFWDEDALPEFILRQFFEKEWSE